jgi:nitroreductase
LYSRKGVNGVINTVVCQDEDVNENLGRLSREAQFKDLDPKKITPVSAEQPSIRDDLNIKSAFYGAPTVLTFFAPEMTYTREDVAMTAENMQLAAHFLGVGACYIGRTDEVFNTEYGRGIREQWGIPSDYLAVGNLILGYREGPEPSAKPRREGRIIRV